MNLRRINDVIIAVLLLAICLPALVLCCFALWLEQPVVPITTTERVTRDGRIVRVFVLQITRPTGFGERMTVVGSYLRRLHIDQIPQLLNVLSGELSFAASRLVLDGSIGAKNLLAIRER